MRITVEVLGFSADTNTPPAILIQCDDLKILINAGSFWAGCRFISDTYRTIQ